MDLTDIPGDAYGGAESAPDLDEPESPGAPVKGGPIRERLLDVVTGLQTPTRVSDIADHADCDTETARSYLERFDEMGLVHRHDGRPVRYERNDAYFRWQRIDRIREECTEREIAEVLADTIDQLEAYRTQFDADDLDAVSPVESSQDTATEDAWEAPSEGENT